MLVFLNGQIVKEEEAKISVNDLSYQFGFGLFETIKYEEGIPLFFEAHFKRLTHAAKELGMPFPVEMEEVRNWIKQTASANKLNSARVKIIVSKRIEGENEKFNVFISTIPLGNLPTTYKLLAKTLSRDPQSISFKFKTTSRADSYIFYKEALENSYNDVLYLNEKNELIECTRANVFLVMEDKIITSLLESGILSGVTRAEILEIAKKENIEIELKNVHSLYLNKAKDVFITNAIIGVMPVSKIKFEDKEYNFSTTQATIKLKNAYDAEVQEYIRSQKAPVKLS